MVHIVTLEKRFQVSRQNTVTNTEYEHRKESNPCQAIDTPAAAAAATYKL